MAKSKATIEKSITLDTKRKVWQRQHGMSLLSNTPIKVEECCCHYVGRGCSGVGYEWNIIGLTQEEHRLLDESKPIGRWTNEEAKSLIRNHLILNYNNWSIENCKYKKYFEESDYRVTRRMKKVC